MCLTDNALIYFSLVASVVTHMQGIAENIFHSLAFFILRWLNYFEKKNHWGSWGCGSRHLLFISLWAALNLKGKSKQVFCLLILKSVNGPASLLMSWPPGQKRPVIFIENNKERNIEENKSEERLTHGKNRIIHITVLKKYLYILLRVD